MTIGARSAEDGQVEPPQAVRVGDHVDFHDLAARHGEPDDRDRPPVHDRDGACGPVHQGRAQHGGRVVDLEPMPGHGGRAVDHHGNVRACRPAVGPQHDIRVESDERIWAVAAWREAPFFTGAERAALALTEAVTRLSDQADPVPDEIYAEVARHFEEPALACLILHISLINAWNRLNAATRQVAGVW